MASWLYLVPDQAWSLLACCWLVLPVVWWGVWRVLVVRRCCWFVWVSCGGVVCGSSISPTRIRKHCRCDIAFVARLGPGATTYWATQLGSAHRFLPPGFENTVTLRLSHGWAQGPQPIGQRNLDNAQASGGPRFKALARVQVLIVRHSSTERMVDMVVTCICIGVHRSCVGCWHSYS